MKLIELINRQPVPIPWAEGETIPWNDPDFSRRMLREHLTQDHDSASRRFEIIDDHVNWIHHRLLSGKAGRILDLGCGPGLYSSRFARLGHDCTGIDFSPASIDYAIQTAKAEKLRCTYHHQDIRLADYGTGYNLAMLIFGEFNVFKAQDARLILQKAHQVLGENGLLLLEPHTDQAVCDLGKKPASWYSSAGGLFSEKPHLYLQENFWDDAQAIATFRYFIVDAATGEVTPYAGSMQAYTDDQYRSVLQECGFRDVILYPMLGTRAHHPMLMAIAARKA